MKVIENISGNPTRFELDGGVINELDVAELAAERLK